MSSMDRPYVTLVLAGLLLGAPSLAFAQSNELVIEQTGSANSLFVDQSEAFDSRVGGLSLLPNPPIATLGAAADLSGEAAVQRGSNNDASITIDSDRASAVLLQDNSQGSRTQGNVAAVDILGAPDALAAVVQIGAGNSSTVSITGALSDASTIQIGNRNDASINVSGVDSFGAINQIGNGNQTGLTVAGAGTSVVLTQQGNNFQPDAAASAFGSDGNVTVTSNGATVVITQTSFGR